MSSDGQLLEGPAMLSIKEGFLQASRDFAMRPSSPATQATREQAEQRYEKQSDKSRKGILCSLIGPE